MHIESYGFFQTRPGAAQHRTAPHLATNSVWNNL